MFYIYVGVHIFYFLTFSITKHFPGVIIQKELILQGIIIGKCSLSWIISRKVLILSGIVYPESDTRYYKTYDCKCMYYLPFKTAYRRRSCILTRQSTSYSSMYLKMYIIVKYQQNCRSFVTILFQENVNALFADYTQESEHFPGYNSRKVSTFRDIILGK